MNSIEDNIRIQTTQQIDLEQSVASIAERILATIIDYLLIVGWMFFSGLISSGTNSPGLFFVFFIPSVFFQLIMNLVYNGQSIGKKALKIKIVKLDGSKPSFGTYFIRWAFRLIDINATLGSLGTICIIVNSKGQRVGDMAAGTVVVRVKKEVDIQSIFVKVPENYKPVFSQVINLNDKDINLIREAIDFWNRSLDGSVDDLASANLIMTKARTAYEKKLNVKTDMNNSSFLNTILKDYYYLNSTSV